MNTKDIKHKSKFLSLVLRHKPEVIDLTLDENGWADIKELITKASAKDVILSQEIIKVVIETNDKQRFTNNDDKSKIRANQGHSIKIDIDLESVEPPSLLYHGTAKRNIDSILEKGIDKRNRQHVHLSNEIETAKNVGSRHGKPIILIIDASQMQRDGIKFYLSKNKVWLTEFVDAKYITI